MNIITPIFPCKSLSELLEFYQTLGFEVTYHQKNPNPYAIVEKRWIRFDFYGTKHHVPLRCYHTCYILTDEADELYEEFTDALRNKFGKLPTRGLPRISAIRDKSYGVREFMFSDIAGNCIRIGRKIDKIEEYPKEIEEANKRLALALDYAYKLEDEVEEYEKASTFLDKAIERDKNNPCPNLYRVILIRADLAIEKEDFFTATQLLNEIQSSKFLNDNPNEFKTELQRAKDLLKKIGE
ncbi:VOC family protein [Emticicia sp. C21]|uniref:bleomycin resistance protein n=1 Tax=Emticicia sp. C21 TaxID=2302915 RepID=UPI000E346C44|nr:VOC family protein [Emticicia sp. C21]RFS14377.1 VOC family protein [Emticicia sp. C21]